MFFRKVKFLDLIIMIGEGYVEWAMRINELSELADQDFVQSQDIKLIKYCEGPKPEDKLHDLLMDMEPISWARAQEVIRRYAQNLALKADLKETQPKGHIHVINSMQGDSDPQASLQGNRERNMIRTTEEETNTRGWESSQSRRNSRDSIKHKTLLELRLNFRPLGGLMPQSSKGQEG